MATEAAARSFFTARYFAVVGASNDPAKFGHKSMSSVLPKTLPVRHPLPFSYFQLHPFHQTMAQHTNPPTVFSWYTQHSLPVTPINPSASGITTDKEYPTLPNLSALPHPTETSVSIITPPKVTMKVLEEAKKLGIQGVWLQPGTFDPEVLGYAMREFKFAVGGDGGMGGEGWCVLVDGERVGRAAGLKL